MSEDRPRFLTRGNEVTFSEGDVVFRCSDPLDPGRVYYVIDGRVEVSRPDAGEALRSVVEAGGVFGVVSCYGAPRHAFTARAVEASVLYCWTREDFDNVLGIYQEMALQVILSLSSLLRRVNDVRA